jgi:nuclease S1
MGRFPAGLPYRARLRPSRVFVCVPELLEPGESLADASTWADDHSREIPGSNAWHFVNVPIWNTHYDPRDCRGQGCVVSKIAEFKAALLDPKTPATRRRTALRFLIHLVQDVTSQCT